MLKAHRDYYKFYKSFLCGKLVVVEKIDILKFKKQILSCLCFATSGLTQLRYLHYEFIFLIYEHLTVTNFLNQKNILKFLI